MDKTVKIRAYVEPAALPAGAASLTKEQALEFTVLQERLQEERDKSLEQLKTIVQLREAVKQEQAKAVEAEKRANQAQAAMQQAQSAVSEAQRRAQERLDGEMKKTVEAESRTQQLQAQLAQLQARLDGLADQAAAMQAKDKEVVELRTKLQELVGVLSKVGSIIDAARLASKS